MVRSGVHGSVHVGPALIVAALAISFAAIFFREAMPTHPLVIAGGRLVIAALALSPFVLRAARARRLTRPVVLTALLCGLAYAVHFGTWVASLELTSVAASVTLVTATPLLLGLVALATGRDRPDRRHWIAIGLAIWGVALIGGADFGSDALTGDALALAGAAAMVVYLLAVRRLGDGVDPWAFVGLAALVGGAALLTTALLAGVPIRFASTESLGWVALSALVPHLVGHTLLTWSLRHARPTVVGLATVGEPVGATLLGWVWLGEVPTAVVLLGCSIVVGAVTLTVWRPEKPLS